jgi:hypothetical protein
MTLSLVRTVCKVLTAVTMSSACSAVPTIYQIGISRMGLELPTGWRADEAKGAVLAQRVGGSGCIVFFGSGDVGQIGYLCEFRNSSALDNVGIARLDSLPQHARSGIEPGIEWVTLSASSVYALQPSAPGGFKFDGQRDCDNSGGTLYRASATCFVAIQLISGDRTIYAEFVLTDHFTKGGFKSELQHQRSLN